MQVRYFLIYLLVLFAPTNRTLAQTKIEVSYTSPETILEKGRDTELTQKIKLYLDQTPSGEKIQICIFKLSENSLIQSIINAHQRNVKVRIVINNGDTSDKENDETVKELKSSGVDVQYLINPVSENAIIHNKFILISGANIEDKFVRNITIQTSMNFTKSDQEKIQDLIIMSEPGVYYCYQDYFNNISVLGRNKALERYTYFNCEPGEEFKMFFYPKRKNEQAYGKDNIEKLFQKLDPDSKPSIHFLHAKWDKNRDNLIDELDDLQENGAKITVIANESIDNSIKEQLDDIDTNFVEIEKDNLNIHSKIILIQGEIDGKAQYIVLTGSHNLTEKSIEKNFEVLLEIRNQEVYRSYLDYINSVIVSAAN